MSKPSRSSGVLIALAVAAAAALAAYAKRPVRPPERAGTWHPVESRRTRH